MVDTMPMIIAYLQAWRFGQMARVALNSFLMAFAATTITDLGYGATRATSALLWTFFALAIFHMFSAASVRHFAVPAAFGLPQVILIIIIFGLAFRGG